MKASKIAEKHGFDVIHGIVDSIWLSKVDSTEHSLSAADSAHRYINLKKDVEEHTGFSISFEGVYKWIVFDSSKINPDLPALNRYFGVFEDGSIKMRGIETRRHDTPQLFVNFQEELLKIMSNYNNIHEITKSLPILENIYQKYINYMRLSD